jgi:uncharacterized protein YecE (DUF72 family)
MFAVPPQVEAAPVTSEERALAAQLPERLWLGTSSWSFPGWDGLVWARSYEEKTLAHEGLRAYAERPLLNGVGLDRTHYAPITAEAYAAYRAQTPAGFRMLVKAHDDLTLARFPTHARYGQRKGQVNPGFLDAAYARDVVIEPTVEGLGDRLGVLLFQFAPQDLTVVGGPLAFAERLCAFLEALPALPHGAGYAVEVRNEALLTDAYREALTSTGTSHCLNAIHGMPSVREQVMRVREAVAPARDDALPPWVVVRWMLRRGYSYGEAFERYHPFSRIVDDDAATRGEIARVLEHALQGGKRAIVTVNNKAEGCAPKSLEALARELGSRL